MEPMQSSNGPSDEFRIPWKIFVQMVLDITIKGYQKLHQANIARRDWDEDVFTINLEDYIRPLAYPLIFVKTRTKMHTAKMKSGETPPKQAKEIDMQLFGNWSNYHKIHFVWECKKVSDKRIDKDNAFLISEYVTEGVFRFLDAEYAAEVPDAGMLGYVLAGNVSNIVRDINASMCSPRRKRKLSSEDNLTISPLIDRFSDTYQSHHTRSTDGTEIRLRHLFLTFDFPE